MGKRLEDAPEEVRAGAMTLARLIVEGTPIAAIARRLKISRDTIYARLRDPDFRDLVARARAEASAELLQRLVALDKAALRALADCLGPKAAAAVRLQAVRLLWEARHGLVRDVDFQAQLDEVKEALARPAIEGEAREI